MSETASKTYLTTSEAARVAGVTPQAVLRWCQRIPGLATRVVGRWRVDPAVLNRVLAGEIVLKETTR